MPLEVRSFKERGAADSPQVQGFKIIHIIMVELIRDELNHAISRISRSLYLPRLMLPDSGMQIIQ